MLSGTTRDTKTNTDVKSTYLTASWVTLGNLAGTVVRDDAVRVTKICVAETQAACAAAGIK